MRGLTIGKPLVLGESFGLDLVFNTSQTDLDVGATKHQNIAAQSFNFGVKVSAVRNLMEGNNVSFKTPNSVKITRQELSRNATDGTVYLTCWMTTAQIEQMKTTKVLFEDLN